MEVPDCFTSVMELRGNKMYRDLSSHHFSGPEKDFLCEEVAVGEENDLRIEKFDNESDIHHLSLRHKILTRYNIEISTFKHWQRNIKKDKKNISMGISGRPYDFDLPSIVCFKDKLDRAEELKHPISYKDTHKLLVEAKIQTLKRRLLHPDAHLELNEHSVTICDKTVARVKQKYAIRNRKCQDLTDARLKALQCARLAYIGMCFIWILCKNLPAICKWNADATTVECKAGIKNCVLTVACKIKKLYYLYY